MEEWYQINSSSIEHKSGSFSECNEDLILEYIFENIGTDSKYAVDFGAADGLTGSTTRRFRMNGWNGLMLDGDPDCWFARFGSRKSSYNLTNEQHKLFLEQGKEWVKNEWITKDNINQIFEKYEVPKNLDLLCIDIDGNDYWVWEAIDEKYQPTVVCIEFNYVEPLDELKVMPYREDHKKDKTNFFGATLSAMKLLGQRKNMVLLFATKVNAIFIHKKFIPDDFEFDLKSHFPKNIGWENCKHKKIKTNLEWHLLQTGKI